MEYTLRQEFKEYTKEVSQQMEDLYLTFTLLSMIMGTMTMIGMGVFCCRSPPPAPSSSFMSTPVASPSQPSSRSSSPRNAHIQHLLVRSPIAPPTPGFLSPSPSSSPSSSSLLLSPSNLSFPTPSQSPTTNGAGQQPGLCWRAIRCCARAPLRIMYCIFCCSSGRSISKSASTNNNSNNNNNNNRDRSDSIDSNDDHDEFTSSYRQRTESDTNNDADVTSSLSSTIQPSPQHQQQAVPPHRSYSQQDLPRVVNGRQLNSRSVIANVVARRRRSIDAQHIDESLATLVNTQIPAKGVRTAVSTKVDQPQRMVEEVSQSSSSIMNGNGMTQHRTKATQRSGRPVARPRSVEYDQRQIQQILGTSSLSSNENKRRSLGSLSTISTTPPQYSVLPVDDDDNDDIITIGTFVPSSSLAPQQAAAVNSNGRPTNGVGGQPSVGSLRPLKMVRKSNGSPATTPTPFPSTTNGQPLTVDVKAANGTQSPKDSPSAPLPASNWPRSTTTTTKSRTKR
jgi:hypothetical protein